MPDEITLEEALKLVSFIKDDLTGKWHVHDVEGNVVGCVGGNVVGNVCGDIGGDVNGDVDGSVDGEVVGNVESVGGNVFGCVRGDVGGKVGGQVFNRPVAASYTRGACDDTGKVHVTKAR